MNVIERMRSVVLGEQRNLSTLLEERGLVLERRDPQGATSVGSPYTDLNKTMVAEWNGDDAIRLAYYSNVYVYRAVFQCASAISGLSFRVGANPEKPDQYDNKSPLAKLLSPPPGGPNPKFSARKLWAWTVSQYIITGKWAWEVECEQPKGAGAIVNLWPLVSCILNPIPSQGGNEYFTGYAYGKPNGKASDIVNFNQQQVIYGWRPAQHDIRQPESALMSARLSVSVAVMQDRYDYAFLRNDARPAAIVVHEAFAQDEEKEAFKRAFRADFRGPDNAGKALFLEASGGDGSNTVGNALDVKVLGLSQRDAQFIQRYAQKISDICVALGTPLSILGDSTKRTYDAANVEHRNWWEGTLQPLCYDLQDDVNTQLVPRLNQDEVGWFDFSKVVALQSDSRLLALGAILPLMVGPGKPIAISEFRGELGLSDVRPADPENEALVAAAQPAPEPDMTTGADGRPLGTPVGTEPTAGNAPKAGPPAAPGATKAAPGTGAGTGKLSKREQRRVRETRETEWRAVDAKIRGMEPLFEDAMKQIFEKQAQSVLARLSGRRGKRFDFRKTQGEDDTEHVTDAAHLKELVDHIWDGEYWEQETVNAIKGQYGAIMASAIEGARSGFSVAIGEHAPQWAFGVTDPGAKNFIMGRANQLAGNVNDTTYASIQQAISDGIAAKEDVPSIADRIQDVFSEASDSRATTIARTEVISAYNGSNSLIANSLPDEVVNGKEWLAEVDNKTRETHVEADGQQVAKADDFTVGGYDMRYPGDENAPGEETINCRCTTVLLTPEDWNGPDWKSDDDESNDDNRTVFDLEAMRSELQWAV